jgi:hypothetical protein
MWPTAYSATRAAVSYRHQSDFVRWVGEGSEDSLAATNRSPVAVPIRTTATGGTATAPINVRTAAYDQDGDTLTVATSPAPTASTGTVTISSGNLVYTPPTSLDDEAVLTYTLRDVAGKTSVGKVYVDVSPATVVTPTGLFENPFNKDSVHHRPLGLGREIGIAPGLHAVLGTTGGGIPYDTVANKDAVDAAMARIGRWIFSTGAATFKYMHKINPGETNTRKVGWRGNRLPCSSGGGNGFGADRAAARVNLVTVTVPAPGTTYDGITVAYPPSNLTGTPNAGDNSVLLWPKNGESSRDVAVLFNEYRYTATGNDYTVGVLVGDCPTRTTPAPAGQQSEARFIQEYPLSGTDIGDGSGASKIKSPSMYLRWVDIQDPNHGPINHALQLVGTRDAGPNDNDPTPSSAHLLSKRRCWPSQDYDGGSGGATNANANLGPFPYGQRFFIEKTTANINRRNDITFCENNRQRRFFDCMMYYGMVLVDGHGQYFSVGGVKKGEFRVRCDNLVPTSVQTDLIGLMKRCHDAGIIRPMYNPRPLGSETERYVTSPRGGFGDGLCFAGGGGPIDSNSVNSSIVP